MTCGRCCEPILAGSLPAISIRRGRINSGTSRCNSIVSMPSVRLAPTTFTWSAKFEAALEGAPRDAAIQQLARLALIPATPFTGDHEQVLLGGHGDYLSWTKPATARVTR